MLILFSFAGIIGSQATTFAETSQDFITTTGDFQDAAITQDNVIIDNDQVTVDDNTIASEYEVDIHERADTISVEIDSTDTTVTIGGEEFSTAGTHTVENVDSSVSITTVEGDYTISEIETTGTNDTIAAIGLIVFLIFLFAIALGFFAKT